MLPPPDRPETFDTMDKADADVRCCGGVQNKDVMSTSDPLSREMAARQLVANYNAKMGMLALIRGALSYYTKTQVKVSVTYADGGTEAWYINPNKLTSAQILGAVTGSLKPGNGEPQPSPNC